VLAFTEWLAFPDGGLFRWVLLYMLMQLYWYYIVASNHLLSS